MKGKLPKNNQWMFRVVRCKAYMKKIHDGRFIGKLSANETGNNRPAYFYVDTKRKDELGNDVWQKEVEEYCGNLEFVKTYYQHTSAQFMGVVVGFKMVTVSAYLYVDTAFDHNGYDIGEYIGKQIKDEIKCASVYYGCNRSRLVPLNDLEIIKEIE